MNNWLKSAQAYRFSAKVPVDSAPSVDFKASGTAFAAGNGIAVEAVRELTCSVESSPWLALPPELRCMIRSMLDVSSQLNLAETCWAERGHYTTEDIHWLMVQKKVLALMATVPLRSELASQPHFIFKEYLALKAKKVNSLERFYPIILNRLLDENISDQACREAAALAEKFSAYLIFWKMKAQLNHVLLTKPSDYPWQAVFTRLARINLQLCVRLITMASPNFDAVKEEEEERSASSRCYPFTELYPLLAAKLQFAQTGIEQLEGYYPRPFADNIQLDNPRATHFFRQIRECFSNTTLHFAVKHGYLDIVPALIQDHPCIDLVNTRGDTALIQVAYAIKTHDLPSVNPQFVAHYKKAIPLLLQCKADPNVRNNLGDTALIYLAGSQYVDFALVDALLKAGAEVNLQDAKGETALTHAKKNQRADIVQALLARGGRG
jgi:hypothetical protein